MRVFGNTHSSRSAFTLVELLAVIAIVAVLMGLLVINSRGLLQARGVSGGAALMNDTIRLCAQNAVSAGRNTFLVVRTSGTQAWQRISIFEPVSASAEWRQIDRWRNFPTSAFIDPGYEPATEPWSRKPLSLTSAHSAVPSPVTAISDGGTSLIHGTDYLVLGFLAGGGLMTDGNVGLRIAAGRSVGGTVTIDGGNSPDNWVKIIVEKITAQPKEILP